MEENQFMKGHNVKRVKVVEHVGTKIIDLIGGTPWGNKRCGEDDCFACGTYHDDINGLEGQCSKEGCVYRIDCVICKGWGVETNYWGETSQSVRECGRKHQDE